MRCSLNILENNTFNFNFFAIFFISFQIRHPIDETQCLTCQLGTLPDATKQICQKIPEVYLRPESAWAIGAMAFSATGILVTLFVVGVFVR